MGKQWLKPFGAVLVASSLLAGGSAWVAPGNYAYAAEVQGVQQNVINVVGKGEIQVKPDIAYLSIGVNSKAETAASAQKANAAKIQKVTNLLKNTWKISADDIQTSQFYVQPDYTYSEKDGQKVKGYTAHHTLTVTYRDMDKIGDLLDAASQEGANTIENVRFTVENPEKYESEVIAKAVANADVKAGAIAKAVKRELGTVLSVSQSDANVPVFYASETAKAQVMSDSKASTQIEAGQVKVSTVLNITYEMK
ncbi:MAG: SIMPL domain-containing protein [Paenibacillus sp.]|uniref:SIMPL domain-containing protein n=1 Tax=Paenibacillus sp. TaxID=58172 RepID=UPI0025D4FA0C|nr:SIMPL domain-containing protein [Paenibacillus sp.]MBR2566245.1 SIMPL domain-containing protein [Paenibacillus sp.]